MSNDWPMEEDTVMTKVVILGNQGVGKTSMLTQYCLGQFPDGCAPTIGASFRAKVVHIGNYHVKLQMWDTAGQERFKSMTPMYYRSADAAILVFDIQDPVSFESVKTWVQELKDHAEVDEDVVLTIAANKADTLEPGVKPHNTELMIAARRYADSINATLTPVSAKTALGLNEMFLNLSKSLLKLKLQKDEINIGSKQPIVDLESIGTHDNAKRCC